MSVATTAPTLTLIRTSGQFAFYIGEAVTNANNYRLEQAVTSSFQNAIVYNINPAPLSASKYNVTGLITGMTYYFRIRAEKTTNPTSFSYWSLVASNVFASVPDAVSSITTTPGNASVSLAYTAPLNGGSAITGYKVERSTDNSTWTQVIASTTSNPYSVTGLTNGTLYYFRLTAINALGSSSPSVSVSATPRTTPGTPTSVTATILSPTSVSVSFIAPASNGGSAITSYVVTPSAGATASGASSPIVVSGLTTGQAYTFRVKAVNAAGAGSDTSPSASVSLVYNAVSSPSGTTFTYASGIAWTSSKVTYTSTAFSNVTFNPTGSAWTITAGGQTDTLIGVRKVVLSDKIIYLGGSGANSATSFPGSSTIGSYTMTNTNTGGHNYIANYVADALAEYTANTKAAVVYLAGDTIYTPSSNPGFDVCSPVSIIGVTMNSKKPLISRWNQDVRFMSIRNSDVRIENVILDLYLTPLVTESNPAIDIGFIYPNLTLLENITFKDVVMARGYKRGVNMNYVSNVTFDGCTFARVTDRATIGITSCKNVTIKNCTIPRSGSSLLNYGSVYINTGYGARDVYRPSTGLAQNALAAGIPSSTLTAPGFNATRNGWTDAQKLEAVKTTNIDMSLNNTFTDDVGLPALINVDTYKVENVALQYSLTYRGASPNIQLPSGFGYAFTHDAAVGITIPKVYITKNSTDITGSLATWGFDPTNVIVRRLDTNARIYPQGYELTNIAFDPTTLTTETEIPVNIGGTRTNVQIRDSETLAGLTALDPVFITGASANPKLALFTDSDVGAAVKSAIDKSIDAVVVQRRVKGSTKTSTADIKKRSAVSVVTAAKTIGGKTQTATADITSLPSTHSVILSIDDVDAIVGLKANVFLKVVDGSGNLVTTGLSIPVDFDVPGTESISALDLYRYETSDYVKLGVANKKAGTTTTFTYTFTTNSDYQLRQQVVGGGAGDPYIKMINGTIYKLPSFNGFVRMFQGNVDGKLLTINAETKIDDDKTSMEQDNLLINTFIGLDADKLKMKEAMSFFKKLYISYGNDECTFDIMNGIKYVGCTWPVIKETNVKRLDTWTIYQNLVADVYDVVVSSNIKVRIGITNIRNVRNYVEIYAPNMESGNGVIVNMLSSKNMMLKNIQSKAEVSRMDANIKRHLNEVFATPAGIQQINIPYIG